MFVLVGGVYEQQMLLLVYSNRKEVVDDDVSPDTVLAEVDVVDALGAELLVLQNAGHSIGIVCKHHQ